MRQALRLVQHGVPWNVATELSPARRLAMLVMIGENDGGRFDWAAMKWRDPK